MKFAEISISYKKEDFCKNKLFLKLPDFISNWYLLHSPFYIEEMTLSNAEGYKVKLYQETEQQKIEQLLLSLKDKGVDILLNDTDITFPPIIDITYGNIINSFFVLEASKKAMKRQSKTLKESKFLIIDGENFITDLVIDMLYPHINYLSIYTNKQQNFYQKAEEIYEECGLRLELFSDIKKKQFEPFNIIINCSSNMDNYDYKIQKNAFFFDVIQNKQKLRCLMSRRNDLLLSNGLLLKWENKTYLSKQIEAILCVTEYSFHHLLCSHNKANLKDIETLIKQKEICVSALTCFEKRV